MFLYCKFLGYVCRVTVVLIISFTHDLPKLTTMNSRRCAMSIECALMLIAYNTLLCN